MSQAQNRNGQKNDLGYWIAAIILLMSGIAAPIGFLMIVLKLLGGKQRGRHPYYVQQDGQTHMGARTTGGAFSTQSGAEPDAQRRKTEPGRPDPASALERKGKRLAILGGVLSALFALVVLSGLGDAAYWLLAGETRWFLEELIDLLPLLCCLGGGLGCLWAGLRKRKQARRYRSYLAMIGRRQSISVSSLASAAGRPAAKVREDLEDMLNDGMFPSGFLNYGGDMLVLSGEGLPESAPVQPKQEAPKSTQTEENAILAEIRAVNDAVANEKLSAQIDRIGVITAKILDYQKSHPEKAPQLHSFLSYYLPTTLKILRAYGQLEAQEISGTNISAAMSRIEGMMDKVVEGFEKQLDLLFQGDAMDITTDVEVLERMLAKDGLSDQQGLTLWL